MSFALVLGATAVLVGSASLAARIFPAPRPLGDRAVATGVLAVATAIACVRLLAPFHGLSWGPMLAALLAAGALELRFAGAGARKTAVHDAREAARVFSGALVAGPAALLAWIGLFAFASAGLAAYRYAPWAWDALGYHLPIVEDAIATRTLRVVPTHIPYVNVYPRAVETFFVAARLLLHDDRWIDFAQAPFGVLGAVVTASFARRLGASRPRAAAFGLAFLAVPLVTLQLAVDYVDVAVASLLAASVYFATRERIERRDLAAWAIAAGLFLASKPSAPPVFALLAVVVAVRAARAGELGSAMAAIALAFAIGGEAYVANVIAHANPIWPIALDAGPLHLPGEDAAAPMFVQGLPPELARASWSRRVVESLFAEPRTYIYDMRLGGLGPMVAWALVPLGLAGVVRGPRRAWGLVLLAACSLASPAAHWMRFSLALPIALLALAASALAPRTVDGGVPEALRGRAIATRRAWLHGRVWPSAAHLGTVAIAVLAAVGLSRALPGLDAGASGIDGHEAQWASVREKIAPGEAFAFDASFSLPGQLSCGDGRAGPALFLGDARTEDDVDRALAAGHARVVVAGDASIGAAAIQRSRDRYTLAFRCPLDPCNVYVVRDAEEERAAR